MKKHRFLPIALCLALLAVSCGESGVKSDESKASDNKPDVQTSAETEFQYEYPTLDCEGEDFTILNYSTTWGYYSHIDFESLTGDILDDAIFNRNRTIEKQFNFNLKTEVEDIDKNYTTYKTAILSGDAVYDAAICRSDKMSTFITEGYLWNVMDIPEIQIDEPWWDQAVADGARIGSSDKLYIMASDFHLSGFDVTMCTFFNERFMTDLGEEMPYQLVRDGKWTFDKMYDYMKLGASLNGDESYGYEYGKSATYGMTSFGTCVPAMVYGANERYVDIGSDGLPYLACENDRFYSVTAKIADMLSKQGEFLNLNSSGENHYEMVFKTGRALLLVAQLKASFKYRDMQDAYGVLPMPKFDENQQSYCCYRTGGTPIISIPVTNNDPTRAGIILDALSYLSWRDVLPVYYDLNVSQKALRNEDSIEMLSIIRGSRYFDVSRVYAWCDSLYSSLESTLSAGNPSVASIVASNKTAIETNIQKTLELLGK